MEAQQKKVTTQKKGVIIALKESLAVNTARTIQTIIKMRLIYWKYKF